MCCPMLFLANGIYYSLFSTSQPAIKCWFDGTRKQYRLGILQVLFSCYGHILHGCIDEINRGNLEKTAHKNGCSWLFIRFSEHMFSCFFHCACPLRVPFFFLLIGVLAFFPRRSFTRSYHDHDYCFCLVRILFFPPVLVVWAGRCDEINRGNLEKTAHKNGCSWLLIRFSERTLAFFFFFLATYGVTP